MTDEEKRVVDTLKHCAAIKECMSCIGDPRANGEIMEPSMFSMPPKCLIKTMNEAADLIERLIAELKELRDAQGDQPKAELETAKSSRWISVKDRLPEVGTMKYLACIQHPHGPIIDLARYLDIGWAPVSWDIPQWHVTHWMPLPEPPKEG